MRTYETVGLGIPEVFLPKSGLDLARWAVIACDQYTSEPEYWHRVSEIVGNAPSTLNLIYPEVFLNEKNPEARISGIRERMDRYLDQGLFEAFKGFIYIERQTGDSIRRGLMACLDLERYDFRKGSTSLIRPTEGTILERIPPRVKIRQGAPLELPHIMVLIDDPEDSVIGSFAAVKSDLRKLYDFELMMNSGRLAGYLVDNPLFERDVLDRLRSLADPASFVRKYGLKSGTPVLLYAVGDGNHSLATAKTIWEKAKEAAAGDSRIMASPQRYTLVELVNLHDQALVFTPIHRILFHPAPDRYVLEEMENFYALRFSFFSVQGFEQLKAAVDDQNHGRHRIGVINAGGFGIIEIRNPDSNLPVGTLQNFLDAFLAGGGAAGLDYVHGTDAVIQLGRKPGNTGFYLPAMNKKELFKTIILDGTLPRKTFSMGEAWEKRFYMEARKFI